MGRKPKAGTAGRADNPEDPIAAATRTLRRGSWMAGLRSGRPRIALHACVHWTWVAWCGKAKASMQRWTKLYKTWMPGSLHGWTRGGDNTGQRQGGGGATLPSWRLICTKSAGDPHLALPRS